MNTDTQTLTDTESMQPEMIPVIIVEVEGYGNVGPCYCRNMKEVVATLEHILGEDAEDGDWRHWAEDGEPFIHIRTGLRAKAFVDNLEAWEL